jgi:hypothetical protein
MGMVRSACDSGIKRKHIREVIHVTVTVNWRLRLARHRHRHRNYDFSNYKIGTYKCYSIQYIYYYATLD